MKKIVVILSLILLLGAISAYGMDRKPDKSANKAALQLKLIEPVSQNIQINCAGFSGRVYFIDDLILNKSDILEGKICFLLSKDFIFTELFAHNKEIQLREYSRINLNDFEPDLDAVSFKRIEQHCKIYELVFDNKEDWPDRINVKFKYHIKDQSYLEVFKAKKSTLQMNGVDFWYPRNPNRDEALDLTVKTTDDMIFSLNGSAVNYSMTQSYAKEYKLQITDPKDSPSVIIFKKNS